MRRAVFLITVLLFSVELIAQQTVPYEKKLSVGMREDHSKNIPNTYLIATINLTRTSALIRSRPSMRIIKQYHDYNLLSVYAPGLLVDTALLKDSSIRFIDALRIAKEEKAIDGFDPGINSISYTHRKYPAVNGSGMMVSIKEKLPDSNDIDFKGRFFSSLLSAKSMSTHATNMATMIAGGGNSDPTARGVAWSANITSSDFISLVPDNISTYINANISVQNHSYGTGIENYYGADAGAYDKTVQDKEDLLHVFSSGNVGDQPAPGGLYQQISGFANITGSFKMSKNTITVGAIDSFYRVETLSSRGPAYDGRLKPELVAYGHDGSSGAAAIVSGTALLLQQVYKEKHDGPMPAALAKAIMINTADDAGNRGIDFASGYGSINADRSVSAVSLGNYFSGTVVQDTAHEDQIVVPEGIAHLKITLCYTDVPAAPNADKALVNDLDLLVTHLETGTSWHPWVLNTFPHPDSLRQPASRKKDTLNNVEQVSINFPVAGTYAISVSGSKVSGSQPFSVAYEGLPEKTLYWTFPTSMNDLIRGSTVVLRWTSTFPAGNALLESTTDGLAWIVETSQLDIARRFIHWKVPENTGWVQFRININGETFTSDTIAITGLVRPTTGFHCADSAMLYWNAAGVNSYRIYQLGDKYLNEVATTNDTLIIMNNLKDVEYFAIAPMLQDNIEGRRSYAFNYTAQGTGCYVKTFLADNINGLGQLTVLLGTVFNIQSVTIEKWGSNGFIMWKSFAPGMANFRFTDSSLITGMNVYRLKIQLVNQQAIYSGNATLFNFSNSDYILYPNPVRRNSFFTLASKDADDVLFKLYNATGSMIMEIPVIENLQHIYTTSLPLGIYFYTICKKGKSSASGRMIIQ